MGTFYDKCDGHRRRIWSWTIVGYLRFRSSFFLFAVLFLVFYTGSLILSTTVDIWGPLFDSGALEKGSAMDFGTVPSDVVAVSSQGAASSSTASATPSPVPGRGSGKPQVRITGPALARLPNTLLIGSATLVEDTIRRAKGKGKLEDLFVSDEVWVVEPN